LANLANFYDRQIVAALAEAIKDAFALTDARLDEPLLWLLDTFQEAFPLRAG